MSVTACGDDEGAIVPSDMPDGAAQSTAEEDAGPGDTTAEDTSEEDVTSAPTDDAGDEQSSAPVSVDAGGDAGDDEPTDVDAGSADSGVTSEPSTDGGAVTEGDGGVVTEGDGGGGGEATPCESACAAAALAGCEDNSTCEADICSIRDVSASCVEEADAYLACIGELSEGDDFTCTDNKPAYTSTECDDPYFYAWVACLSQ